MSFKLNRRSVLRGTAAAAAAISAGSYSRILGANNRISLALIGCGGRGRDVMGRFVKTGQVDVPAVCDVWPQRMAQAKERAPQAKEFGDHRKLLDQVKNLDAVLIATPDHWHAPISIDALNAGKDVYVEKPLTLKIEEGPEIVRAARNNKRVCQVGMQQRSGKHYLEAKERFFSTKKLGKVTLVRTHWNGNGAHLLTVPEKYRMKPADLDWARYVAPVRYREWDPPQFFNFRAYLDFGGGQVTDLFTHWIDVVHMFMEQDNPTAAVASGGVYHYRDGRTAPDTIQVVNEYPGDWIATFEATLAPFSPGGAGIEFYGTEGRLQIDRGKYQFWSGDRKAPPQVVKAETDISDDHIRNFLDCMASRKLPNGDVYAGHRSAMASHLGNIAYLQKRRIRFDPDREEILPL